MECAAGYERETLLSGVRCREILESDFDAVVELLTEGFSHERDRRFWRSALTRLAGHQTPEGFPRFGHVLDHGGALVGVVLQIFTRMPGTEPVRCSMSSWYVAPKFRMYASLLISRALRPAATYMNATPVPHTWPVLEAQGYTRYCNGRVLTALWLARRTEAAAVLPFADDMPACGHLTAADIAVLRDHAAYGCLSLVCVAAGRRYPFVFMVRRHGPFGIASLVYARADAPVSRFAGALGRHLARRGIFLAGLDADGPLPGLPGRYFADRPKYFKGPDRPRIGDHAYSERVLFGS